jgi:hypothetical protein
MVVLMGGPSGSGRRAGPGGVSVACRVVWLVARGPARAGLVFGARDGRSWRAGARCARVRCVGAEQVGQRGPHGQDQDRQAGHDGGDGPGRPGRPGLGQQVVGDLPGHAEGE